MQSILWTPWCAVEVQACENPIIYHQFNAGVHCRTSEWICQIHRTSDSTLKHVGASAFTVLRFDNYMTHPASPLDAVEEAGTWSITHSTLALP